MRTKLSSSTSKSSRGWSAKLPSKNLAVLRILRKPSKVWARMLRPIRTSRDESTEATQTRRRSVPYAGSSSADCGNRLTPSVSCRALRV